MENRSMREAAKKKRAGIFLGSMMVLCAVLMLIVRFTSLEIGDLVLSVDDGPLGIISRFILLAGGIAIIVGRNRGNYFAIGVYAMTLGMSRLLRSLPGLIAESDITFYISIFIVVLSANLVLTGYNHLTVMMKNPLSMRYTTILIVVGYAVALLYFAYSHQSPKIIMEYLPDTIWYIPLYLSLLVILYSAELVNNSPIGRIRNFSGLVADRAHLGNIIEISEDDAAKIKEGFNRPQGWNEKTIDGILVHESTVTFYTGKRDRDVILERSDDNDELRMTVIDDRTDSFINGYRMRASSYTESDDMLVLRDGIGVCATLRIRRDV